MLESLLAHPQVKPVPLTSVWAADWQQSWRDSLAATGPDSWEAVSLHLSMLGRFAVVDEYKLGRDAFMRTVTNSRWALWCNNDTDVAAVIRSTGVITLIGMVYTCYSAAMSSAGQP